MAEESSFIDPMEDCNWLPCREIYRRLGFEPLPPGSLDDGQMAGRLWEFIYALAALRFYLYETDHLSDRELYAWLYHWFDGEQPDISPEAGWNCLVGVAETGNPQVWLRYFGDEETRQKWAVDFPKDNIPPREKPPFDRDRFLPEPPNPGSCDAVEITDDTDDPDDFEPSGESEEDADPLGLAAVDRAITENNASADEFKAFGSDDEFEAELVDADVENWTPPAQELARENVRLLPPDEITDEMVGPLLWELLHNLAVRGFYVLHTNHLGDRELYADLWKHALREPAIFPGRNRNAAFFHDFCGSGSEEDTQLLLRYYYDDRSREMHERDWPDEVLPPKMSPPFSRDWRLPKAPF